MPFYIYEHPDTGIQKRILHPISEVDEPSEDTLKETTTEDGRRWNLIISGSIGVMGKYSNKSSAEKKKIIKEIARKNDLASGVVDESIQKNRQISREMKEIGGKIKQGEKPI